MELLPFPDRITIELTNCCNLECRMCHRSFKEKETGFMDISLLKKIMDEASPYNVDIVPFFRGESLMHPDFVEIMKYIRSRTSGLIQLATNGYLLSPECSDQLIDLKIDFISISLDAINQELYQEIRGRPFFNKVMDNIAYLLSHKKEKPEVQVSAVETHQNKSVLPEFIDYWKNRVERVRVYPHDSADGNPGSLPDYYKKEFRRRLPCKKLYSETVIYWDGAVAICNHDWRRPFPIGNVNNTAISKIWSSEAYNSLRRGHENGVFPAKEACVTCDYWITSYLREGYVGRLYKKEKN